jgi:hypothetical protein
MRPAGYFKKFQASIATILTCIAIRLAYGYWSSDVSRSRQRHWLKALKKKALAFLGLDWMDHLAAALELLIHMGHIPVSRSFKAKFLPVESYPTQECRCSHSIVEIGDPPF